MAVKKSESEKERDKIIAEAEDVHSTINSPGWQKVIGPGLRQKRDGLIEQFKDAKEHIDLIYLQQAICAIDNLKIFIEVTLAEGKEAFDEERKRGE